MDKPLSHQIDDHAKRIFQDALPPTWVPNEFFRDYAKDFHVEIGDDNGQLTGTTFIVQLKGHKKAKFNKKNTHVSYQLERKHAIYYADRMRDAPVFLVVVDVSDKLGWYIHLQPYLLNDQGWRKQKSCVIRIPVGNRLSETPTFRRAVVEAQKRMRLLNPLSIQEAVKAQIDRMKGLDARFDFGVTISGPESSLVFELRPKEKVNLRLEMLAGDDGTQAKLDALMNRGESATFEPGEIRITGSKLFQHVEQTGATISSTLRLRAASTFICRDAQGAEIGRIDEIPGEFAGGIQELHYAGGLDRSPLALELGPIRKNQTGDGSLQYALRFKKWNGQPVRLLAYFDRIHQFFKSLDVSASMQLLCMVDGNQVFSAESVQHEHEKLTFLSSWLTSIHKMRKVCDRFNIEPIWDAEKFTAEERNGIEELYGVYFEGQYKQPCPHFSMKSSWTGESKLNLEGGKPQHLKLICHMQYELFGVTFNIGKFAHEVTDVILDSSSLLRARRDKRASLIFNGTATSIKTARLATDDE